MTHYSADFDIMVREVRLEVNLDVPDGMTDEEVKRRTQAALMAPPAYEGTGIAMQTVLVMRVATRHEGK